MILNENRIPLINIIIKVKYIIGTDLGIKRFKDWETKSIEIDENATPKKTIYNKYMSSEFLKDYLPIMLFLFIALGLSFGFIILNYIFSPKKPDPEKLSAYECGFEPFNDSRMEFDVRFYLVAILFIIFDLEIAFLFPWAISLGSIGLYGYISMLIFLFILTIGFIYEWKKGALDWE